MEGANNKDAIELEDVRRHVRVLIDVTELGYLDEHDDRLLRRLLEQERQLVEKLAE